MVEYHKSINIKIHPDYQIIEIIWINSYTSFYQKQHECKYLRQTCLVIQDAEDAIRPSRNELQTEMEVLQGHRVPWDLLRIVFLLKPKASHMKS